MTGPAESVHDILANVLSTIRPGDITNEQEARGTASLIIATLRDSHGLAIQRIPTWTHNRHGAGNTFDSITFDPVTIHPTAAKDVHKRPDEPAESVNESGGNVGDESVSPTVDAEALAATIDRHVLASLKAVTGLFSEVLSSELERRKRDVTVVLDEMTNVAPWKGQDGRPRR